MNSNKGQYNEMKHFFDEIRKGMEAKPQEEIELRFIMAQLNKYGIQQAGEKISYPLLNRSEIFTEFSDHQFYLSKGSCFPPYIEFSIHDREDPHHKARNYEMIIPAKPESCDMISMLLIDYLLEHEIPAEVKASTHNTNANIRVFVETEQMAKAIRKYCLRQPLIYWNIHKPNPFIKRFVKENDQKGNAFGIHKNPYGAGMESVEYIAVLITEYVESARVHDRIDFVTVDKFMSSLKKRVDLYRDTDPKKQISKSLLDVYNKAKQTHKEQVEIRNVLTKEKKQDEISEKNETKLKPYSYYNHENTKERNRMMSKEYVKNVYLG